MAWSLRSADDWRRVYETYETRVCLPCPRPRPDAPSPRPKRNPKRARFDEHPDIDAQAICRETIEAIRELELLSSLTESASCLIQICHVQRSNFLHGSFDYFELNASREVVEGLVELTKAGTINCRPGHVCSLNLYPHAVNAEYPAKFVTLLAVVHCLMIQLEAQEDGSPRDIGLPLIPIICYTQ